MLLSSEVTHMTQLGPRAGFWTAALVAGLALWASGAPTVVYPLYAQEWDLSPAVTTLIFAIYPLTLIPVLVLFGNLSDYVGRRAAMLVGLGALAAGSVAFGLAPDLGWVLVGRALMGVGVGLSLGPASAALVDFSPPGAQGRATTTTTAATATGLVLATLVGGALVEHAPAPLHLTFWVLFVITLVAAALVWFLPRPLSIGERWRPRRPSLPAGAGTVFWSGALAIGGAYAMGAIFLALGAQVARDLVGSDDAFVGGAVISVSAAAIGVVAVLVRKLSPRRAVTIGPPVVAAGLALLVWAGLAHSIALFLGSSVIGGAGYSLLFAGGLGLVTVSAPARQRAAVMSSAYVVGYLLQALAALGIGAIATRAGLLRALEVGSPIVISIGLVALVLANARRPAATTLVDLDDRHVDNAPAAEVRARA